MALGGAFSYVNATAKHSLLLPLDFQSTLVSFLQKNRSFLRQLSSTQPGEGTSSLHLRLESKFYCSPAVIPNEQVFVVLNEQEQHSEWTQNRG